MDRQDRLQGHAVSHLAHDVSFGCAHSLDLLAVGLPIAPSVAPFGNLDLQEAPLPATVARSGAVAKSEVRSSKSEVLSCHRLVSSVKRGLVKIACRACGM